MNKIKAFISAHKFISTLIALVLVIFVYYKYFKTSAIVTQYALATVQQGTIVSSISGTGQVSGSSEVSVNPKVSGTLTYVDSALEGKSVKAGTVIATIDSTDAQKTLRDAQLNLEKLQATQVTSQPKLQDSINNDQNNLVKNYQDVFAGVSGAFLDLPGIFNDADNVLYANTLNGSCKPDLCDYQNLVDLSAVDNLNLLITQAQSDFAAASVSYTKNFNDYGGILYTAPQDQLDQILAETIGSTQLLSQSIKSEQAVINTVIQNIQTQNHATVPSAITAHQTTLASDLSKINNDLSSLLNVQGVVLSDRQTLASDQRNLVSAQQTNPLDLITQQNAVADAQQNLSYYTVRVPIDGIVANITAQRGANASSGGALATMVSPQQIADVTLNEVDVSKVMLGQQVTLTFDALPDLTMTGKVISIDTIGTVSQGVVSYDVKIAFDIANQEIKPSMSVSAAIITQANSDALEVPTSAVKIQGTQSYVQTVQLPATLISAGTATVASTVLTAAPQNQIVTTGIQSDTMTEITSGLKVGDIIVVRTITGAAATTTSSAAGGLRIPGLTGGTGGGATRATTTAPGR